MKAVAPESEHEPILEDELGLDEQYSEPVGMPEEIVSNREPLLGQKKTDLRPWYKRPKTWLIGALITITLVIAAVGFMAWRNRTTSQEFMKSDWRRLSADADRVVTDAEQSNYTNFGQVEKSLIDMQERLDESRDAQAKQPTLLNDRAALSAYKAGTDELYTYTKQAREIAADLKSTDASQLDELGSSGTALKLSVEEMRRKLTFLADDLPNGFYTLDERFATVIKAYEATQNEEQAKQDAEKSKEDQERQDKANAEEAVSVWAFAYIAGKPDDMKAVMTSAFIAEYDFNQVTSSARKYNYPTTFRRVNTDKKGDQYEVILTITYVTKSDYSADTTYTQTFAYLVSQDTRTKKWLVNSQRYQ